MSRSTRVASLVLAGALSVGSAGAFGASALAAPVAQPVAAVPAAVPGAADVAAADFLETQLAANKDGIASPYDATKFDYGLTLDAIIGLDAAGTAQTQAKASLALVEKDLTAYIRGGDPKELYAGATAKTLFAVVAQGGDPTSFGGMNLVTTLQGTMTDTGRFSDTSQWGDYSNTIGQSFAIIGLKRAGQTVDPKAIDYLAAQQCADGGFTLMPTAAGGACTSDTDATTYAVQALITVRGADDPAVVKALDFLETKQQASGAVLGTGPTATDNANSTGLAAQAFVAGGRNNALRKAQGYLAALQYDCTFAPALRGGFAYDAAAMDKAKTESAPTDQDRRATAQALLGFSGVSMLNVSAVGAEAEAPSMNCAVATTPVPTSSTASPTTSAAALATSAAPTTSAAPSTSEAAQESSDTTTTDTSFPNCTAASATGPVPVRKGDPGYGPHLDSDNDGVGCEPYGGNGSGGSGGSGDSGSSSVGSSSSSDSSLAKTGTPVASLLGGAGALVAAGGGLVLAGRRRQQADTDEQA